MSHVDFPFHHRWKDEKRIAERVCNIVYMESSVRYDDLAKVWKIGIANDWWLSVDMENRIVTVCYRYGSDQLMNSFREVFTWVFE